MNARPRCDFEGFPRAFNVPGTGTGESSDNWTPHRSSNDSHGGEITFRSDGEPSLDDIDAQPVELMRHTQFLGYVHAATRRLFAVAQGRVENRDAFHAAGPP